MAVDKEHSAPADPEERASKETSSDEQASEFSRWLLIAAVLALTVLAIVTVYGYLARPQSEWIGVANKSVWDWLDLLVVPAALAIGVYWLNTRQAARQQQAEDRRKAQGEAAQKAKVQHELEVEDQRAQDAALQAYLDQMSRLLTDAERPLRRAGPRDDLSIVARARTLTVLPRLNGDRKARVVQFLYEAGLISSERLLVDLRTADLREANLNGANLSKANLSKANLSEANVAGGNLAKANLQKVDGRGAAFYQAYLREADMRWAAIYDANLHAADLREAKLSYAIMSKCILDHANLSDATLDKAILGGSDLRGADLSGAFGNYPPWGEWMQWLDMLSSPPELGPDGWDLELAISQFVGGYLLQGATMPNGQKYEDWLNDQEDRGEDAENE